MLKPLQRPEGTRVQTMVIRRELVEMWSPLPWERLCFRMTGDGCMKAVDESARWRVLLLAGSGTELLPGHRFALKGLPSEPAPVDVELWTRFEDQKAR
ncbi:hypothetical protein M707_21100 [Arthrobacter sp. AK-YN10]|nr:hypothetical protein M707_21100 [Arthrobacter sp. AK-YN10]